MFGFSSRKVSKAANKSLNMFRLEGMPPAEAPADEKRKVQEAVKASVFSFLFLCAAIRVSKYFMGALEIFRTFFRVFQF